ncbi:unnamed protein product [Prorocentrum cordatum]|uniref:Uncharacterized protein n=1 Tax=Prorocentrum cordatum TaxID=2364126 RepID=A0ABN9QMT3_9DINO|nr:unnamed protein product [Polarella glacialis]
MSGRDPEQPPQDEESSDRESQSRCASRCFPIQPFLYCPGPVKLVLPGTWQKIQDGTHLTLVFGVLSCFGLIVQTIVALSHGSTQTYFAREVFVDLWGGRALPPLVDACPLASCPRCHPCSRSCSWSHPRCCWQSPSAPEASRST